MKFQGCCQSRRPKHKLTFTPFGNDFLPSPKNIIFNVQQNLYPSKQKDICEYDPICFMPSGLVSDGTIINIFRKKALEFHVEVVDSYFTNTQNNTIYIYRGSLQYFYWKKVTHESIDVVCPYFNVEKKTRHHFPNILNEIIKGIIGKKK